MGLAVAEHQRFSPPSLEDRPLVTFALFAYNQEKYVREAVEGAFEQTYEPLEIILSDDCSTDRTFEIMREMAAQYRGKHRVRLRKSEVNFGTAQHVYAVSVLAKGALLIVAAGDDISNPSRCKEVVDAWVKDGAPIACIHSAATTFTEAVGDGVYQPARTSTLANADDCRKFLFSDRLPFLSPTCAYSIELFRRHDYIIGGSIIEDGVMSLRSLLSGEVISVDKSLVNIRLQNQTAGTGYSLKDPVRWNRFVLSRMISYANMLRDVSLATIEDRLAVQLEKDYKKKIVRLSSFLISSRAKSSILTRAVFCVRYFALYPSGAKKIHKIADAMNLTGFTNSTAIKRLIRFCKNTLG